MFTDIGPELPLAFQLKTFQGVRFGLFHYNASGAAGGQADFDSFTVVEPRPRGLTQPIPAGRWITFSGLSNGRGLAVVDGKLLTSDGAGKASAFQVVDRGSGRIALRTAQGQFVSVSGAGKSGEVVLKPGIPGDAETFQWVDLQRGDTLLLSLATHRYIAAPKDPGPVSADHPGPAPDRKDGSCFTWKPAQR
ncbi:fascin domain-containing protein [Paludibaculum fermentans]|uniref:fascin domain-containing protein n=1 Tax=Paludibaculum fermentans TaxID=1473598 RepID=UPI002265259D|nr:hypothetical protein [Paludibaculum fermentans]